MTIMLIVTIDNAIGKVMLKYPPYNNIEIPISSIAKIILATFLYRITCELDKGLFPSSTGTRANMVIPLNNDIPITIEFVQEAVFTAKSTNRIISIGSQRNIKYHKH